jgi:type VI secretion system (T6SS) effector TldE1-like protein
LGFSTGSFANSAPLFDGNLPAPTPSLPPSLTTARNTPDIPPVPPRAQKTVLPLPRPASAPPRNSLADSTQGNQSAKPSIFATIFEKLFGKRDPVKLAYATTDDAGLGVGEIAAGRYDQWTAVYDISARIVYMPDGTQLEAHSGFGSLLDDPSHVDEKMHGATPPNVYDLELREKLFHGVRALRLIPQDERKVFGRAGFLVHTFMLGPNGDSNGCVSIKNYDAFLQAYRDHKIKRLAVVASL